MEEQPDANILADERTCKGKGAWAQAAMGAQGYQNEKAELASYLLHLSG
jgi:hypothetical protein